LDLDDSNPKPRTPPNHFEEELLGQYPGKKKSVKFKPDAPKIFKTSAVSKEPLILENCSERNLKPPNTIAKIQIKNLEELNKNTVNSPQTNGTPNPDFKPGDPNPQVNKGGFGLFIKKKKVKGSEIIDALAGAVVDKSLGTIREKSQESSTPKTHLSLSTKAKLGNSVLRNSIYVPKQEKMVTINFPGKNSWSTLNSILPEKTPGNDQTTKSNDTGLTNLTKSTVNPIAKIQTSGYFIGDCEVVGELWSNGNDRPLKPDEVRMGGSPKKCTIQLSQVFDGRKICDPGEFPVLLEQSDEDFWAFIEGTGPEPEKKVQSKPVRGNSPGEIRKKSSSRNCDENRSIRSITSRKSRKKSYMEQHEYSRELKSQPPLKIGATYTKPNIMHYASEKPRQVTKE
jgi:hypothetical protein